MTAEGGGAGMSTTFSPFVSCARRLNPNLGLSYVVNRTLRAKDNYDEG